MTSAEKLDVARALARLGVDVIEAGYPAASPDDLEAVRRIAQEVGNPQDGSKPPVICGLARTTRNDIDKVWEAVKEARYPRIHTFLATGSRASEPGGECTRSMKRGGPPRVLSPSSPPFISTSMKSTPKKAKR